MAILFRSSSRCHLHTASYLCRGVALLLAVAVSGIAAVPALAETPKAADPAAVEAKVRKLGVGAHVMVRLTEGEVLRGHIVAIGDHNFTLRPDNTGSETQIAYDQVVQVRKNPGALTWMLIGAGLALIIVAAAR